VHRARKARDIAAIEVLANTGLRVGELAALMLVDVELSARRGWVTVRKFGMSLTVFLHSLIVFDTVRSTLQQ
jgi:integrase